MKVAGLRRLLLLGAAVTGVVAAHAADYALSFPDPARRSHELAASGHGYWPVALALAVAAGVGAACIAVRRGLGGSSVPARLGIGTLATAQVALFVVVECVERLGAGVDPRPFLHSPQLALGIVLQVAVAGAAVVVLRFVERGTRTIAGVLRQARLPRRAATPVWARPVDDTVVRWWGTAGDARGPPAPALS
ncbi:MAG: hypothetical protein JWP02_260 [Acidimicrobiales bacterium]|nr:hypothetical protein [Acidimicrobiales bacterium]